MKSISYFVTLIIVICWERECTGLTSVRTDCGSGNHPKGTKLVVKADRRFDVVCPCGSAPLDVQVKIYEDDASPNPDDELGSLRFTALGGTGFKVAGPGAQNFSGSDGKNGKFYKDIEYAVWVKSICPEPEPKTKGHLLCYQGRCIFNGDTEVKTAEMIALYDMKTFNYHAINDCQVTRKQTVT